MERKEIITPEWRKPIIAVPLAQAFPELHEVKEFKSKVCLFNHDRTKVFDVVSNKYQVIDHGQAMDVITESMRDYFHDQTIEPTVRSMQGGARIVATFKMPIPSIQVKKGDLTDITMLLRNSYDRSSPFVATLGGLRLVCTNGMKASTAYGSVKSRHVGLAAGGGDSGNTIYDSIDEMVTNAPKLGELWREWADTKITLEQATKLLAGQFPMKYIEPVLNRSHFPRSKWDLYNDLTRFATHDTKTMQRRLDFDDKIARLFYGHDEVETVQ